MDASGTDSAHVRQTILGSLLRGRHSNNPQSQSHPTPPDAGQQPRELSPSPPASPTSAQRRAMPLQPSHSHNPPGTAGVGITQMLRRRRSAGSNTNTNTNAPGAAAHRIRLVPHLESRRSLRFDAICRDLREGDAPLRIGRFTDRSGLGLAAVNAMGTNKLAFKSKVVSRAHAEIWVEAGGRFYVRDTRSSSGTFLNHSRLSPANGESRAFQVRDGDILQLGVDYQGGAEDIYKSVKIRVEIGREWQQAANAFNTSALRNLKALSASVSATAAVPKSGKTKAAGIPDCCICLFAVTIHQALFIAPCSHTFHYKCIRPLLESHHPAFSCPLCRTFADLEEDVEVEGAELALDGSGEEESAVDEAEAQGGVGSSPPLAHAQAGAAPGVLPPSAGTSPVVAGSGPPARSAPSPADRERERERGAETEVEDAGPSGRPGAVPTDEEEEADMMIVDGSDFGGVMDRKNASV